MNKKKYGAAAFPEELAKEFKLVDWVGGHVQNFGRFGTIDLSKLTQEGVERLIAKGFTKIEKKKAKSAPIADKK